MLINEVVPSMGLNDTIIDEAMGVEPRGSKRVRELHEVEEFVSDNESEHDVVLEENIEFESDDDGVIETNDNEDEEDVMQP
jgi:hypothetical protein